MHFLLLFACVGLVLSDKNDEEGKASEKTIDEKLDSLDTFKLDLRGLSQTQFRLAEAAKKMIKEIEQELKVDHKLKPKEEKRLQDDLNGFVEDLNVIKLRFLELSVKSVDDRLKLADLIEILGAMMKTIKRYINLGPHKKLLEKVTHGFKNLQKSFVRNVKEFGSYTRKAGAYLLQRGYQFEQDDDSPEEYKNAYFTAMNTYRTPKVEKIEDQVSVPFAGRTVNPWATDFSADAALDDDDIEDDADDEIDDGSMIISKTLNDMRSSLNSGGSIPAIDSKSPGAGVGLSVRDGRLVISIPLASLFQLTNLQLMPNSGKQPVKAPESTSDQPGNSPAVERP